MRKRESMQSLKYAKTYIKRHPILSSASVFSLSLAFFAALLFCATTYASNRIIKYFESKAQISAYLKDTASEADALLLRDDLLANPLVAAVNYVSKSQAKSLFVSQNADNKEILEALDGDSNPFPASLEIEAKNIAGLSGIAAFVSGNLLVEDLSYHKDVVDALRSWTGGIRLGGLIVLGAFGAISLLVVLITVSLTIFSKKDEIEIMKLLGAPKSFVRWPFIMQGAFYGFCASLVSLFVGGILLYFSLPALRSFFRGIPFMSLPWYWCPAAILGWVVLGGFLGGLVSFVAVARYLKE
ncbi:MAG: permease-like cell division protein FtsX [bacterium]